MQLVCSDGSFERKALGEFVSANKLPLVVTFSRQKTALIFQSGITKQVLRYVFFL